MGDQEMTDILKGKVAIVTGSGQGIGRSIAIALGKEGAKVVTNNRKPGSTSFAILTDYELHALKSEEKEKVLQLQKEYNGDAETTAQTVRDLGGEATAFFGDVSQFNVAEELIKTAIAKYQKIDILVNVAGTFRFSAVWEMSEETWDQVCSVKPKAYFNCIRHAAPYMMEQKWGRIINCTSKAWAGDPLKQCNYAAANAGVVGLTRGVANELWSYGITCNAFTPFARTRASFELNAYKMAMPDEKNPYVRGGRDLPLESIPSPDEIGPFMVYLASDVSAKISGSVFVVSGKTVGIYEDPDVKKNITKYGDGSWTFDELKMQLPRTVLQGYQPRIQNL
jgi:3-oxoacyl-[acyl-carrier protein] reductase